MNENPIELSLLSLFTLISFFIFLIIQKFSHQIFTGKLLDNDFLKPQAFHQEPISRAGGVASIILILLYIYLHNLFFSKIYYEYLAIGSSLFLLGFVDDLKFRLKPSLRLLIMISILLFCIHFFSLNIKKVDLIFLDNWLRNQFFLEVFILICFLFVINGSNLIDGFNGLLAINLLIINFFLVILNLETNQNFTVFLVAQIVILGIFLLFNFPKAKMFFGDSGSYLFGSLTALNIIYSNNFNSQVSSFFFCILLVYVFFEVFFSFFRKIYAKKSPLEPDGLHLHMLIYKLLNKTKNIYESNYKTTIAINLLFFCYVLPSYFLKENAVFCKLWFIFGLIIYVISYYKIYKKII